MTIRATTRRGEEISDQSFAQEVKEKSQAHLERCYQCLACGSGCPVAYAMDYPPNQVIRMVQLGLKEGVLDSNTIWLCASCETCATRCPNDIDIVRVMDTLREMALKEGRGRETNLPRFHDIFLGGIRSKGRIHELSLIMRYMITSGDIFKFKKLFNDAILGVKMFLRRKLNILPSKIKRMEEIERIFKLTETESSDHGKTEA